ncbi:hypothetical protein BK126_26100 [Paenibacillus sp. FSL H7-0326]|uniref:hypothetical protein n=1 Tax=Paenibacillus sp. FSL H7-0326 TaxID=1921144 RepID=UPI00096C9153|nr:hypothetical protein [Paenibacillus sp. FSL H7-0326]OMC63670.1 hypothetical protein BK126_26100 [Paenibacillus sp. FSL H7-0326]
MTINTKNKEIEQLADSFKQFLEELGLWRAIRIYFNGMAYDSEEGVIESINVAEYMAFYDEDTLTVLHEGSPLGHFLNNGKVDLETRTRSWDIYDTLKNFFEERGYTILFGTDYSFTISRLD